MQQQHSKKIERMILEFNKSGLSYLTNQQYNEALDYLKKADKVIQTQLKIGEQAKDPQLNKLAGITYNNLACYYKKTNKPNVALKYLKKALELQVFEVGDWTSTASTHLNICAIYSFMHKHQQSSDHASLAISMLQKINTNQNEANQKNKEKSQKRIEQIKAFNNILMLAHYNYAIQLQHLKKFQESQQQYKKTLEVASLSAKRNESIIQSSKQSLQRVEEQIKFNKKRFLELLTKKKQSELKGNYEYMRRNKKNIKTKDGQDWSVIPQIKRYEQYAHEAQRVNTKRSDDTKLGRDRTQPNYASLEKIGKLQPNNTKNSMTNFKPSNNNK